MTSLKKIISLALVCTMLISTVACLGSAFTFGASADDTVYTDYAGKTYKLGEVFAEGNDHVLSVSEQNTKYDALYGAGTASGSSGSGGWVYLASQSFEVADTYKGEYAIDSFLTATDGYVQPGQLIFTKVTYGTSSGLYIGLPTLEFGFSSSFFDLVTAPLTADVAKLSSDKNNSDLQNFAARMNQDNAIVSGLNFIFKLDTLASHTDITINPTTPTASKGGGLTTDQLLQIGAIRGSAYTIETDTCFAADGSTWLFGYLLKVKAAKSDSNPNGLEDGDAGAIFIPRELYKRKDGNKNYVAVANQNKVAYSSTKTVGTALADNGCTMTFVTDDFGCAFVIGEPVTETYKATFMNGSTEVSVVDNLTKGASISNVPSVPDKEGFNPVGWGTDAEDVTSVVDFSNFKMGEEDVTFYALYSSIPHHNVTYVNPFTNNNFAVSSVAEGEEYTIGIDSSISTDVDGYTFDGWTTVKDDASAKVTGSAEMGTADVIYYALYKINQYTVTFDANGGEFEEEVENSFKADYNSDITAITAEPTRTGYDFKGWAASSKATAADESLGKVPAEDVTFYAVWAAKTFKVNAFASEDMSGTAPISVEVKYGDNAPTFKPTDVDAMRPGVGYAFLEWADEEGSQLSTSKNAPFGTGTKYQKEGDTNIYAKWTETPVVNFYASNGDSYDVIGTFDKTSGIKWADVLQAAKDKAAESGVTFNNSNKLNWYSDEALTTVAFGTDGSGFSWDNITENAPLYLGKADSKATVTIGEGENAVTVTTADKAVEGNKTGIKLTAADIAKATPFGKTFAGIYDTADESQTIIEPASVSNGNYYYTTEPGTHNYAAKFDDIELTVNVNLRAGGKTIATLAATDGDEINASTVFTPADESKPVPAVGDELSAFNLAGYCLVNWKSPSSDLNTNDGFVLDEATLTGAGAYPESETVYVINLDAVTEAKLYKATVTIENGGTFSISGNNSETVEVAVGTTLKNIQAMVAEQFGDAVKEGYIALNWDYDKSVTNNGAMPAQDFSYTIKMSNLPFKAHFMISTDEEGNPVEGWSTDIYYGEDSAPLFEQTLETYRWKPYNIFLGWELTDGEFAEDGTVIGDVTITADYDPFSNYLLIVYNSNITGADVPLTTGASANDDIYMTVSKKLKISYWKDGERVSRKDTECNLKEGSFTLFYLLKFVGKNDGGFYINACPFTLPWSIFDPREIGDTIKLIGTALKNLL